MCCTHIYILHFSKIVIYLQLLVVVVQGQVAHGGAGEQWLHGDCHSYLVYGHSYIKSKQVISYLN